MTGHMCMIWLCAMCLPACSDEQLCIIIRLQFRTYIGAKSIKERTGLRWLVVCRCHRAGDCVSHEAVPAGLLLLTFTMNKAPPRGQFLSTVFLFVGAEHILHACDAHR
jgi:hypothetical protein